MNLTTTIQNLLMEFTQDRKIQARILQMENEGFLTSGKLLERGIYSCFTCGHLNALESANCSGCGDEKFIVRDEEKVYQSLRKQARDKKEYKSVI